jgi:ankyrin repeat protein
MACDAMGNLEVLRELLKFDTVDVNCPDRAGERALIVAIRSGNLDAVRELLKHHKVELDRQVYRAVLKARYAGNLDIVRELLKRNDFNVNHLYENGNTVLKMACEMNNLDIVCELLK